MIVIIFLLSILSLFIFSFGFIDPHLSGVLPFVAYYYRPHASIIFFITLVTLFILYIRFLINIPKIWVILVASGILLFSYPALTYDLFNYITTAKVLYTHHENPYVVMPIEIPNEPNLAFTRAANKFGLYGPVWLGLSAIPHFAGGGNIWATILAFKFMNVCAYLGFCYLIWKKTANMKNVIFFALNPLILIEVIMNAHNDIYMMILALFGGYIGLFLSGLIKGATLPLIFVAKKSYVVWYWILTAVFFVVAPLREELYPWYAVWLISTASIMNLKKQNFIYWFTIILSFALELRYLPYMWMGYYEGLGPLLRFMFTIIPLGIFFVLYSWKNTKQQLFS